MKFSIITCYWIVVILQYVCFKADETSDYVKNCIDHPDNDNGEELDEFPLIGDDPEFWEIECDSEDDCPSDWVCHSEVRFCFAPAYIPSYYDHLRAGDPREVVNFKQSKVKCDSEASLGCNCIAGYRCENDSCLVQSEFAAEGVNVTELNAVGGVSSIKISPSLVNTDKNCICLERYTGACYRARCRRSRRWGNMCFCDLKWYKRKYGKPKKREYGKRKD